MEVAAKAGRKVDAAWAREAFAAIVGDGGVLADDGALAEFHDPFVPTGTAGHRPSLVVQPETVEQVRACVALANRSGICLWTSSMGRNFGYGGSAPVVDLTVVLNLRRLNQILEIDVEQGYALVEPGVTFHQLYEALRAMDAPLMMSVPDLGWGSMVANALQHGIGYNILGDHASALCGLEVVLPDGDLLRTGQGAIANSPLWNSHRRGFGPALDDLFKQSNFGIVTKAGIRLAARPETILCGTLRCEGDGDVGPLVDVARSLLREDVMQGVPMIVGTPAETGSEAGQAGEGGVFTYASLRKVLRPGRWNLRFGLYGHSTMVEARLAILRQRFAHALPQAELEIRRYPGSAGLDEVEPRDYITAGIPNQLLLARLTGVFGPDLGHQDFSPVLPITGDMAVRYDAMVRDAMDRHGVVGAVGMMLRDGSMTGASMIMFDRREAAQLAAVRAAVGEMGKRAAEWGCAPYRAHVAMVDAVADVQDFNDHALRRTYGRIKDALDPNGILSPGNHGIWPGKG
ncbi:MAG: FAD-binding oxidoreductase [Sphingomonadales bacterium]|nr:FAD-binding oxidoreductase [Sphingomonadales bacterium]MBD3772598.1 FAD-binding oxidoreductase [Paracoccaceae bacterium]